MSVQVGYGKQFLLGFILILLLLGITEIILRIYDYYFPACSFYDSEVFQNLNDDLKKTICYDNSKLVWEDHPLRLVPSQNFKTITINSDGFRGNEIQKNPDYRIFMIGGSTTFGVGATSDSKTIPSYLQHIIDMNNNDSFNIEVINAGIPKAFSFTEIELIQNKILAYQPDLLIIYDGFNDLRQDFKQSESSKESLSDSIIRKINRGYYDTPKILIQHYFNYKHNTIDVLPFNSSNINEKTSLWKERWEKICQNETNFKTIIILQPQVDTKFKPLTEEEIKYYELYDLESANNYYQLYANKLNELNDSCDLTIDLRDAFISFRNTIYFDHVHMSDFGNEIIANQIYEKIIPIVSEDIKSKTNP